MLPILKIIKLIITPLVSIIPADNAVWVFTSQNGDSFDGNAKYQFLYSSQKENVRAIWISNKDHIVEMLREEGYEAHSYQSIRGKLLALRSGYMFFTHTSRSFIPYSGNSTTVQLWHGNMLKQMGNDNNNQDSIIRKLYLTIFGKGMDFFLVTSSLYPAQNAKSAYGIEDSNLIVAGYPRTDVLYQEIQGSMIGIDSDLQKKFELLNKKGLILCYFPTWNEGRDKDTRVSSENIDFASINECLESFDATLIIKQHPSTQHPINDVGYENIVSISKNMDIYPFLDQIDILITDYSSIYFDYLLLDRPILFYPYDLFTYIKRRGLYFEYDKVTPGLKAYNPHQLTNMIESAVSGSYEYANERSVVRNKFYEYQDGKSCERIHKMFANENDARENR